MAETAPNDQLEQNQTEYTKKFIRLYLFAKVGAGLENKETTDSQVGFEEGHVWKRVNELSEEMVKLDPEKAFNMAVGLVKMKKKNDKQELMDRWYRTVGLYILGIDGNENRLDAQLSKDKVLFELLQNFMKQDVRNITSSKDTNDPRGWTTIQSIYVCLGLKEGSSDQAIALYKTAEELKKSNHIQTVARLFKGNTDDAYLNKRL